MNVYFLSGLGVDKSVFKKLDLLTDSSHYFLEWIPPLTGESISSYAKRMTAFIDGEKPFVLIGLSFGGMVAVQMNKFVKPIKTIIISSAATQFELPWFVKVMRYMPLHKIVPSSLLKRTNRLFYYLFGIKTKEEKSLLKNILRDTDVMILKWSINAISEWHNKAIPSNLIHIHGDADKLLPINCTKADIVVSGGGHFMIYSRAAEISQIINQILHQPQL